MAVHLRHHAGCADLLTLAARHPRRYPGLLDSAAPGPALGRWSILFAFPAQVMELHGDGRLEGSCADAFLPALDAAWRAERIAAAPGSLPFRGGWLVLLCHELAGQVDPALQLPAAEVADIPVALAIRCPAAILVDHMAGHTWLMAERGQRHLLDQLSDDLAGLAGHDDEIQSLAPPIQIDEDAPQRFVDAVAAVHTHIAAGEVNQVNIGRRWRAHFADAPNAAAQYAALRSSNPAPFAALLQQEGWAIASSSPERLVRLQGRVAQMRPIAGTYSRSACGADAARIAKLRGDPKERAEHLMLLDLVRDDLEGVCRQGSLRVDEFMVIESHPDVHHIVSNVRGQLRNSVTPGQLLAAIFPGGSVTGWPKHRCLQIIAAQEGRGRGPYTGALGYLSRDGNMDMSVLIRSMVLHGRQIDVHAGAGITAQSRADTELAETRVKARGMLRALGEP